MLFLKTTEKSSFAKLSLPADCSSLLQSASSDTVCRVNKLSQSLTNCWSFFETLTISVGIDLKELGGQMSKCLKFYPAIEI